MTTIIKFFLFYSLNEFMTLNDIKSGIGEI